VCVCVCVCVCLLLWQLKHVRFGRKFVLMLVFVEKNKNIIGSQNCPCYYHSECIVAADITQSL